MQNTKLKNNSKPVGGAARSNLQNEGITLIALIITIIVMLILVGVTINVALNGGLFEKAKNATKQTQIEADREELLSAVVAAIGTDGKVDFSKLPPSGWTGSNGTYTSPKENTFKVDINGNIELIENETGGDDSGGEDAEGWVDNGDGTFSKGDTTVEIGKTEYTNAEVQEKLGATGGTYTGTWTVIGVEGDKLKLVSTENVGDVLSLGKNDKNVYQKDPEGNITTTLKSEIVDINGDGDLDLEKAIWSYKNAVDTLNTATQTATGIESARSITIEDIYGIIGEENVDKGTEYGDVYEYYFDSATKNVWSRKIDENGEEILNSAYNTNYNTQTFVNSEGETIIIDENDPKATVRIAYNQFDYTLTDDQVSAMGALATGYFWLASVSTMPNYRWSVFNVRKTAGRIISRGYGMFSSTGIPYDDGGYVLAVIFI